MARCSAVLSRVTAGTARGAKIMSGSSAMPVIVFGAGLSFCGFGLIAGLAGRSLSGAAGGLLLHAILAALAAWLALSCLDEVEVDQA